MNYQAVAKAIRCPSARVAQNWPAIFQSLKAVGCISENTVIAVLATIAVETAYQFAPIHEFGGVDYLNRLYDKRTDLGNTPEADGDGARYAGRGYIQVTGKSNYEHYGKLLGVDMVKDPDMALEPNCAAAILALFIKDRHVSVAADLWNWTRVRQLVNGGTNRLADFLDLVNRIIDLKDAGLTEL
jgi:hypothetical protein